MELEVVLRGFGNDRRIVSAQQVTHASMKAVNTKDEPDNVAPRPIAEVSIDGQILRTKLAPASWNVIVTTSA